jgi:hypothetical protein
MAAAPPPGFHSVTPRMVVSDAAAAVEFLEAPLDIRTAIDERWCATRSPTSSRSHITKARTCHEPRVSLQVAITARPPAAWLNSSRCTCRLTERKTLAEVPFSPSVRPTPRHERDEATASLSCSSVQVRVSMDRTLVRTADKRPICVGLIGFEPMISKPPASRLNQARPQPAGSTAAEPEKWYLR